MRMLSLLALFAISSALVSFKNSGVTAKPSSITTNTVVPLSLDVFIPCANGGSGELVHVEGNLHVLITFTVNGNNVSGKTHFQPQGVTGTGLTSGDKYQATGVTQDHFKSSLQNGQFSGTFVNNFRIIGQGPGNNYLIHSNTHITLNASGDVTADASNFQSDCN